MRTLACRARLAPIALTAVTFALPATAAAQDPPPLTVPAISGFYSVLAQGEGQTITATDLAANQASGEPPDSFVNQQPLYVDVMPAARTLTEADIGTYYKDTTFGSMPGGVGATTTPRPGVRIFRDARFGMAHIYGDTREDVMFGAGYATAEERLFLMDALRRTAKGTLAGLTGPGAAEGDGEQLTDQDFSDEELTAQFNSGDEVFGAEGAQAQEDVLAYIDGINQRIDEVKANPALMPAEYPALGATPERWTISDTAAMAVFLVTQFTVSNGGEELTGEMRAAFRERFGRKWRPAVNDFRERDDPGTFTVAKRKFKSDRPGKPKGNDPPTPNLVPDPGSIEPRNTVVEGPGAEESAAARAALPDWASSVVGLRDALPEEMSNGLMVTNELTEGPRALAAMGPQVDYFSPQIFSEYELHGGGIDVSGVSFPGASPYPLIGHGIDFAWSGTSANGDNEDTFVERLCEPDGSEPTKASTHYVYRGECRPFVTRDQSLMTPVSPIDPTPSQRITYRTLRSVHGPVFAYATVKGEPVALAKAKAVDFHELDAVVPFMRLAENRPTNAREFMTTMNEFPGTENWFYVDEDDVAFQQSGRYPRHAKGSDVDLPFVGDGSGDWRGFDPASYTFKSIPKTRHPASLNPSDGYIISWNQKEAFGWRKGPTEWSDGPVHHAQLLEQNLLEQAKRNGGQVSLAGITRAANLAATADVRGALVWPHIRRVIGKPKREPGELVAILEDWHGSGAHRLDADGDNFYDDSAAVALMDAWWPLLVRAQFEPGLGKKLFRTVEDRVLGLGGFGWDWASHVQKDLRSVVGKNFAGESSRVYCGGPAIHPVAKVDVRKARARCRAVLIETLREAAGEVGAAQGTADPAGWRVPATCPDEDPPICDQIVPTTAGAVSTPPFPWQNRGTFHQVDEVAGRR